MLSKKIDFLGHFLNLNRVPEQKRIESQSLVFFFLKRYFTVHCDVSLSNVGVIISPLTLVPVKQMNVRRYIIPNLYGYISSSNALASSFLFITSNNLLSFQVINALALTIEYY